MKGILKHGLVETNANSVISATGYTEVSSILFFNQTENTNVTVKVYLNYQGVEIQIGEYDLVEKDQALMEGIFKLQQGASIKAMAEWGNAVTFVVFGEN